MDGFAVGKKNTKSEAFRCGGNCLLCGLELLAILVILRHSDEETWYTEYVVLSLALVARDSVSSLHRVFAACFGQVATINVGELPFAACVAE